jgi:GTP cyclohydrolase I
LSERRRALISLGSDIDPGHNLPIALVGLRQHPQITVVAVSHFYESAPVGRPGDPWFLNLAALVETALDPAALRRELHSLETALGRVRGPDRYGPRIIDLDLVMFQGVEAEVDGLVIPDPDIPRLPYLALPLADVAPNWVHPGPGLTLEEIAAAMKPPVDQIRLVGAAGGSKVTNDYRYAAETGMEAADLEVFDPEMERRVRGMLESLGEDPDREGLLRTPLRVAKSMAFLTSGYQTSLEEVVHGAIFESTDEGMVVVKDVEFYSLCEHHMLPFFGKASVAYLPRGKVLGLSKIARIVDLFSRRLQIQERLTSQIADAVVEAVNPYGSAVVLEASHFCMMMRGVQKQGTAMITSAMRGTFLKDARTRSEFLELMRH